MIDREVMEVTLKPDLQKLCRSNLLMVNYRPQKFRGLLAPTQYVSVTRLSPAFRVRVWLRETRKKVGREEGGEGRRRGGKKVGRGEGGEGRRWGGKKVGREEGGAKGDYYL